MTVRRRPRIYAAHPCSSYGTDHEAACLGYLAELLPEAELIDPPGRYATDAAWLQAWPRLLRSLSALVIFGPRMARWEWAACESWPTLCGPGYLSSGLDSRGLLVELGALRLFPADRRTPRGSAF